METANERLANLREALGYQRKALFAEHVGIERSTYDKMEKGPHSPSAENLTKILSRFPSVNGSWLLTGKGERFLDTPPIPPTPTTPLLVAEPAATYGCIAPDLVTILTQENNELRAENKSLNQELREARREFRQDFIAQARQYNSVKVSQEELISRLYTKLDEYELRLGFRQPTAQERERMQAQGGDTRMEVKPFGARYRESLEEPQAALDEGGATVLAMYPFGWVSLLDAA